MRLPENTGCKNSLYVHNGTTLSVCVFATKRCIDGRKKLAKQQYLLHRSSQYGELWPTGGWDRLAGLEHPKKFPQVLTIWWTNGILPGATWTLHPSLVFSYIGSVTARHLSSGRQPNFAAFSSGRYPYLAGRPSRASAHILVGWSFLQTECSPGLTITVCAVTPQPFTLVLIISWSTDGLLTDVMLLTSLTKSLHVPRLTAVFLIWHPRWCFCKYRYSVLWVLLDTVTAQRASCCGKSVCVCSAPCWYS